MAEVPASLPLPVEVDKVRLTLRMDATITIYDAAGQATDWIKPGSEASVTWRNGIPSEAEVRLGYEYLNARNSQALEENIVAIRKRLDETRRGR
jgi:hypothetical protein